MFVANLGLAELGQKLEQQLGRTGKYFGTETVTEIGIEVGAEIGAEIGARIEVEVGA